ncbi:MAG: potassium channel family protein [Myxococcota bacterium]
MPHVGFWASERSLSVLAGVVVISSFVIAPLTPPAGLGNAVLVATYLALLVSGIAAVPRRGAAIYAISGLALVSFAARAITFFAPGDVAEVGRKLTAAVFCTLLATLVFGRIFRAGRVTVHRISGAVAAYLLIGLVFAYLYDAIEIMLPGSFHFATPALRDAALADPMTYFSFTTLTTVGYGDITPRIPLTQSLANLESLIGQLFPTILIARLVALELLPHPDGKP